MNADDRVSDALDRLQNRVNELEAAARHVLGEYDEYSDRYEIDLEELSEAIEELRKLVAR
jgi:chemotaxis regulatin CheY-phosphate phosphatase CheZ